MAHGSEGRMSRGCKLPLLLLHVSLPLLLFLWHSPPSASFLHVKMAGTTQTVLLNDNATIFCQVYGDPSPNITIMGVTWFWKNPGSATEVKLFEFFGGQQMTGRPGAMVPLKSLESGNASLQLPGIQLREAGEYRCEVVITPHKAVGQVKLEVVAFPVSSLFPEQAIVKEKQETLILCMSSGFHLDNITITWKKLSQKDPQEVFEGIITNHTIENGMFNVTSFLMLKPSLEDNMTIYQCVIYHKSLPTPQKLNFTLTVIESEKTAWSLKNIFFYIGAPLSLAVILLIIYLLKKVRGSKAKFSPMFWS
ncbi:natural cytotoxicity triggering receptor 3 ligand 1 isoform X1 [Panthera uncia]|uniref:natural cytotoxicity triggering receptor 3 ligand 1 isoform X1 n=1 Tax=Panthera uncia TaxID=29064 RepID=UPI0020FF8394|nr:natural cytotoxicity triggering receptor 3 ligand 1 isoform X1 [Panthera uncia]